MRPLGILQISQVSLLFSLNYQAAMSHGMVRKNTYGNIDCCGCVDAACAVFSRASSSGEIQDVDGGRPEKTARFFRCFLAPVSLYSAGPEINPESYVKQQ